MFKDLAIYSQNTRGIKTKLDLFIQKLALSDYDIIVLTETWLSNDINDAELGLCPNYQVFGRDRCSIQDVQIRGGGVLIAVKNQFPCYR